MRESANTETLEAGNAVAEAAILAVKDEMAAESRRVFKSPVQKA